MILSSFVNEFCNSSSASFALNSSHQHGSSDAESQPYSSTESLYWLKLLLTSLGIALTLLYSLLIINSMRRGKVGRKFYAFLLNRCFGDLLFLCFYAVTLFARSERVREGALGNVSMVMGATFWTTMVSYTSLSFLKLYAVSRPIEYRRHVTVQRCVWWISVCWIVIFITVTTKIIIATIFRNNSIEGLGCTAETCHWYICQAMGFIYFVLYIVTLLIFFATVFYIRRASHATGFITKCSKYQLKQRCGIPLAKLTLNVVSLAVLHFPLALLCAFYAFAIRVFWDGTWPCYPLPRVNFIMLLKTVVVYPMLARIILDSLIGLATEREVRHSLGKALGVAHNTESSQPHNFTANSRQPSPKISTASVNGI